MARARFTLILAAALGITACSTQLLVPLAISAESEGGQHVVRSVSGAFDIVKLPWYSDTGRQVTTLLNIYEGDLLVGQEVTNQDVDALPRHTEIGRPVIELRVSRSPIWGPDAGVVARYEWHVWVHGPDATAQRTFVAANSVDCEGPFARCWLTGEAQSPVDKEVRYYAVYDSRVFAGEP